MKSRLPWFLTACLFAGCGKPAPAPSNSESAKMPGGDKVPVEGLSQPAAGQPPPPPVADKTETPAPAADTSPGLAELTMAVRSYVMTQGKPPGTLEDLAKAGTIKKLPTPPAGKKYVLDPKGMSVLLVDR